MPSRPAMSWARRGGSGRTSSRDGFPILGAVADSSLRKKQRAAPRAEPPPRLARRRRRAHHMARKLKAKEGMSDRVETLEESDAVAIAKAVVRRARRGQGVRRR